ncbi:MAG: MIP/aquaporin family protein [Betaproteobacteria bacterium]
MTATCSLSRRLVAEALGTTLLLAAVVGSGIMGERLAAGNTAIALLANSIATGAALFALISVFAPVSGAHFNPVVTLVESLAGRISRLCAGCYIAAQFAGATAGVFIAHLMFALPVIQSSQHPRNGGAQWFSEFIATFGLLGVILSLRKSTATTVAASVACYITAAYWFTASTSFANPAVTVARTLTDTFSGIRGGDAAMFVTAQLAGALLSGVVFHWLIDKAPGVGKP